MDHKKTRVKALEESLAAQIAEMKDDLSEKDLKDILKSASSVGRVKKPSEYARDRGASIKRQMQVPRLHPLPSQAQTIIDDVTTSTKHIYTADNMPLLLHHFYCQRLEELVRLRHILLVRWARFAVGVPKVTEELQDSFKLRLEHILQEYNHTLERSRTLSIAVDRVLAEKATPTNLVSEDDILMYLRWLVYQHHVSRYLQGFVRSLQWYPMLHYQQFSIVSTSLPAHPPADKKENGHTLHYQDTPIKPTLSALLQLHSSRQAGRGSPKHGSQKVGVACCGLPKLTTSVDDLQPLIQELTAHYTIGGNPTLRSQADELQFYHRADRRFREIFTAQETTFTLHTYDRLPSNGSKRQQKSKVTFKKPSNWLKFVRIRPQPDPVQIDGFAQIRQAVTEVDEFLALSSQCTHLHSLHRVLYALRQHYVFVKHTSKNLTPLSLKGHVTSHDMSLVWKCIYSGVDSRNPLSAEDDSAAPEVGVAGDTNHTHSDGTFDVSSAMKLIHHSGGRSVSAKAHSSSNDGYFAFLLLRHLRIREERHKCLNILNYFRSVERTLTINEEGLSLDSSTGEQRSSRTGLLDHRHLFNTPADYIVDQSEFMQYMEVENHDDFYSFEGSNRIRVWDQQGVGVVYDSAVQDLSSLERELLTVASYYLTVCPHTTETDSDTHHHGNHAEELDTGVYAQVGVDRFAILWDLWREEVKFLHAKMRVINCYLECYHHTSDKLGRSKLAEVITTLLWTRPRYDPTARYFTGVYKEEVRVLGLYYQLLQEMLTSQLDRERQCIELASGKDTGVSPMDAVQDATPLSYGLPHPLIAKQLVSLSGDKHLLVHSYLLECAGSLGGLGELPEAIRWSLAETIKTQGVSDVQGVLILHCQLLETALGDWRKRYDLGSAYSLDLQTHLFSSVVAEDPKVMAELCVAHGNRAAKEAETKGIPPKEQAMKRLQAWVETVRLIVTRHHLILTCSDTGTLTHLYKQQLSQLDQEAYHAHLRYVPFDLSLRLPGDKDLDYFVTKAREGDVTGDRCAVGALKLAVNELDEKHVGVFSFRSREGINKILSARGGLERVVVATTCQLSHCHALLVACQHNHLIIQHALTPVGVASGTSNMASAGAPPPSTVVQSDFSACAVKKLKKGFISIQREKTPVRDHMLARFTKQPSSLLRDQSELTIVKCSLLAQFSSNLTRPLSLVSLRVQLVHHLHDLHTLLAKFPAVKSSFFTVGKPRDPTVLEARGSDYVSSSSAIGHKVSFERLQQMGGVKDPRQIKARPALLLDKNGEKLMNLWYLPHFTEVLEMFDHLALDKARQALERALCLVSALHMFLQYTCAYVRLGHTTNQQVGGAWGGIESVGSQLLQLQSEISRLSNPVSPDEVGQYLWLRCQVAHLAHDLTVRHYFRHSLIHKECDHALQTLDCVSVPALHNLQPPQTSHLTHPFDVLTDSQTSTLVPHRYFDSTHHRLSITSDHTHLIGPYVYSSLAVFDKEELNLAHGELLEVTHLCEMLDNGLIQETIKQLSKLHHLMLSERERDHTTLPLDLWKNNAVNTKEITGLSRSHVVEDFVRLLESKMADNGDTVTVTKTDLKHCVQLLANGVLAREKDCYHLYASYYEALLRSQYNQLYQKNKDIEHYRSLSEGGVAQSRVESLIFMGEHTQSLLLELTALRNKVRELLGQLTSVTSHTHSQVQHEYSQLVNNLFSATMAIKSRYEEYRGHLYDNVTRSLQEVRQSVAEGVKKMKEKAIQGSGDVAMVTDGVCPHDVAMVTQLKNEGLKDIQQENAELSKLVIKMRAVHTWNNYKDSVAHHHEVGKLTAQLDRARVECLELKMKTEQEISSLNQQLQAAQKSLARVEREYEVVRQNFEEERRKKNPSVKHGPKTQESAFRVRGEKSKVAKFDKLKRELETKEKLLKEAAEEKDLANKQASVVKVQSTKVTKDLKQQLRHERMLKSDAFHQVDELLAQVEEYTQQENFALRSSLQAMSRTPLVSSTPTASGRGGLSTSTPGGRRPKSVGKSSRRGSGGETIDLSQEILALKLI